MGERVCIDLYADAGYNSRERVTNDIQGSPLIAVTVWNPLDKYIFCESDEEKIEAGVPE